MAISQESPLPDPPSTPKTRLQSFGHISRKSWGNLFAKVSPSRSKEYASNRNFTASPGKFVVLSPHLDLYERRASQLFKDAKDSETVTERPPVKEDVHTRPPLFRSSSESGSAAVSVCGPPPAAVSGCISDPTCDIAGGSTDESIGSNIFGQKLGEPFQAKPRGDSVSITDSSSSDNGSAFSFERPIRQSSNRYYKPNKDSEPDQYNRFDQHDQYDDGDNRSISPAASELSSLRGSDLDEVQNMWDSEEDLSHLDPDYSPHIATISDSDFQCETDEILQEVNCVSPDSSLDNILTPSREKWLKRANSDTPQAYSQLTRQYSQVIRRGNTVITLFERSKSCSVKRNVSTRSDIAAILE